MARTTGTKRVPMGPALNANRSTEVTAKASPAPTLQPKEPTIRSTPFASNEDNGEVEIRPGFKRVKAREVLPHVSLYLHPKVIEKIKEIAAVEQVRAHAIYIEALDRYLRQEHTTSLEKLGHKK